MSQTSYTLAPSVARAGLVASLNSIRSRSFVNYSTMRILVTLTAANSTEYGITLNGTAATYTSTSGSQTAAQIVAQLVAAIATAAPTGVTVTDNTDGTYTVVASAQNTLFTYAITQAGVQSAVVQVDGQQQVPFGCWVVMQPGVTPAGATNTALATCRLPYQATDITGGLVAGIAMMSNVHVGSAGNTGSPFFAQQDQLAALVEGEIWVQTEGAVNQGDPVYVRYASGAGGSQKGAFRNSSDSSTAALVPNGARYLDTLTGAGFARVAVMLP